MNTMNTLTQQRLKELLSYDSETGVFTWKMRRSGQRRPGAIAGCINGLSYRCIRIDRRLHLAHRLAWLYAHGSFPAVELDHINGNPSDNRLANLREATHAQNMANGKTKRTGLKGVYWDKRYKKWYARIKKDGKSISRGPFDTEKEAGEARWKLAQGLHGEFARKARR